MSCIPLEALVHAACSMGRHPHSHRLQPRGQLASIKILYLLFVMLCPALNGWAMCVCVLMHAGVQAYADPRTGAVLAVEADVLMDSSTAPDSLAMQVLARGPIGKYSFNLQAARVQGEHCSWVIGS